MDVGRLGAGGLAAVAGVVVTAANVADTTMLAALLDDVPPIRTPGVGSSRPPG
jgi:hypothetical protein